MRKGKGLRTESSMFSYRNGLIDQMYRTGEVMKTVADPVVARALAEWHAHLGSVLLKSFETTAPPPNVDTGASNQDKATSLWNILNLVTSDLDAPDAQDNTKRFMMYIAWHEGQGLTHRVQQPNGPALSFFQIQGASAQTAYNSHSMTDDLLTKLASLTGSSHDSLQAGFEALTGSASFPAGNLIGTLLGSDFPAPISLGLCGESASQDLSGSAATAGNSPGCLVPAAGRLLVQILARQSGRCRFPEATIQRRM